VLGATPFAVPAIGTVIQWLKPLPFNSGIQIVLAGTTAGERLWFGISVDGPGKQKPLSETRLTGGGPFPEIIFAEIRKGRGQ
jgi:hypothetical protein